MSFCIRKAILNTNSNPVIVPSLFLRVRHKKLDSRGVGPLNP